MKKKLLLILAMALGTGLLIAPAANAGCTVQWGPAPSSACSAYTVYTSSIGNYDAYNNVTGINVGFTTTPIGAPQWQLGILQTHSYYQNYSTQDRIKFIRVGAGYCVRVREYRSDYDNTRFFKTIARDWFVRGGSPYTDFTINGTTDNLLSPYTC